MPIVHVAAPMDPTGVQVCERCGIILTDYRGTMTPEEDAHKPLGGWATGAHVEVWEGNPRALYTVDDPPTCRLAGTVENWRG